LDLKEGAIVANRFRLVRMLGKGGMGSVWLAQHIGLDIPCAVKFIRAESAANPDARARFEREARAAAQLRTPNVVQILDYGVFEETPYIAMELLVGEPLSARLARRGRLDATETIRIVSQIGRALGKAHQAGIVHRDLKPENVFLVADEEGEIAKVLDFGVAKQTIGLTDSNTQTGALLGTPFYMSPEQAQGTKAIDSRADLWSLAVLSFRCITGELPFRSDALGDLLIKIVMQPLPVPSHLARGVPPGFDSWWERAAQREPDRRFQTAKELVDSLGTALGLGFTVPTAAPGMATASSIGLAPGARSAVGAGAPSAVGQWEQGPAPMGETQAPSTTPWQRQATPFAQGAAPAATGPAGYPSAATASGAHQPVQGYGPGYAQAQAPSAGGAGDPRGAAAPAPYPGPPGPARPYPPTAQIPVLAPAPTAQPQHGQLAPAARLALSAAGMPLLSAESGSGPSVAGFATQAPNPASRRRGAVIGAMVTVGLLFGLGASFLVYRGLLGAHGASGLGTPVASTTGGEPAPQTSATAEPSSTATETASETVEASATPSTEPAPESSSAEVAKPPKGKLKTPSAAPTSEPTAKSKTRPIATTLDVEPKPKGSSKPPDFGF
jgi:hypothetical protein